jgi:hypothetical protein
LYFETLHILVLLFAESNPQHSSLYVKRGRGYAALDGRFLCPAITPRFYKLFLFSCVSGEKFESFDFPGDFKV